MQNYYDLADAGQKAALVGAGIVLAAPVAGGWALAAGEASLVTKVGGVGLDAGFQTLGNFANKPGEGLDGALSNINVTSLIYTALNPGNSLNTLARNGVMSSVFEYNREDGFSAGLFGDKSLLDAGIETGVGVGFGRIGAYLGSDSFSSFVKGHNRQMAELGRQISQPIEVFKPLVFGRLGFNLGLNAARAAKTPLSYGLGVSSEVTTNKLKNQTKDAKGK